MHYKDISFHMRPYIILSSRRTTINHAFASALAPNDVYDDATVRQAIIDLGQDPDSELKCVYCGKNAETWDHVFATVKDSKFSGHGHRLGNLIPCCKPCNSKKGNKDWDRFLFSMGLANDEYDQKRELINKYICKYFQFDRCLDNSPDHEELDGIRRKILSLMEEGDKIAERVRPAGRIRSSQQGGTITDVTGKPAVEAVAKLEEDAFAHDRVIKPLDNRERILGSLLGGAVGDALGAPIEFRSLAEIRDRFGPNGLQSYAPAYGCLGAITDDTQMTLFTAEGLIRARVRFLSRGLCHPPSVVHHAYMRWLLTQGERPHIGSSSVEQNGWLWAIQALHQRRAPGNTCISALVLTEGWGFPERAHNNSKGCGAVMRVAPVGLFAPIVGDDADVFELGAATAAITHGHPSGFLAAGHLAVIIAALARGEDMEQALDAADQQLRGRDGSNEVTKAITAARALARQGRPSPEMIETLGGGWVAEEALAIGICCALSADHFEDGVLLAANHSGDSDSTAAITGNILGTRLGVNAVPSRLLEQLELRAEIERLASDLALAASGLPVSHNDYPPG